MCPSNHEYHERARGLQQNQMPYHSDAMYFTEGNATNRGKEGMRDAQYLTRSWGPSSRLLFFVG